MANAEVSVYLTPFDPPAEYTPLLLAGGTADSSGVFKGTLTRSGVRGVRGSYGTGTATLVNAVVMAVDPAARWLVWYDAVLPLDAAFSATYAANADLTLVAPAEASAASDGSIPLRDFVTLVSVERVDAPDPDGGDPIANTLLTDWSVPPPVEPQSGHIDETVRQTKVLEMHVGLGMRGSFTFSEGRATYAQTAVKIGSQNWSVGGEILEETNRTASHTAVHNGGYHRLRYAGYRWYLYRGCTRVCTFTWRINHWTGDISQVASASQPALSQYRIPLQTRFTRDSGQTRVFSGGAYLVGLSLNSRAQYYANTKLVWERISGCALPNKRWLYGQNADPAVAPTVYATCAT